MSKFRALLYIRSMINCLTAVNPRSDGLAQLTGSLLAPIMLFLALTWKTAP